MDVLLQHILSKMPHHIAEHQKKKEGEEMPKTRPESHHPVCGSGEEARGQDPHWDQVEQDSGCEVSRSAVHATASLPARMRSFIASIMDALVANKINMKRACQHVTEPQITFNHQSCETDIVKARRMTVG